MAKRMIYGTWCGAVGVEPQHSLYQMQHIETVYRYFDCHGGITWTGFDQSAMIEFVPPSKVWWIGFDCMREGDLVPKPSKVTGKRTANKALPAPSASHKPMYRDLDYVKNEVTMLADQIHTFDSIPSISGSLY